MRNKGNLVDRWVDLNLINSFIGHSTSSYLVPGILIDRSGFVHLRGAVETALLTSIQISAHNDGDSDYIEDSGDGFLNEGFTAGVGIDISGFANADNNELNRTVASVTARRITFTDYTATNESAGAMVKVNGSAISVIAVLPPVYRSPRHLHSTTVVNDGSVSGGNTSKRFFVNSNGEMSVPGMLSGIGWINLSNISWWVGKERLRQL